MRCTHRRLAALAIGALALVGCSESASQEPVPSLSPTKGTTSASPTASQSQPSSSPSPTTKTPTPTPSTPTPKSDSAAALQNSVSTYNTAMHTGKAQQAYALLSSRCRSIMPLSQFTELVDNAGAPTVTGYSANILGERAFVSYTVSGQKHGDEAWALESSTWKMDSCN